jgi:hypothetical protein
VEKKIKISIIKVIKKIDKFKVLYRKRVSKIINLKNNNKRKINKRMKFGLKIIHKIKIN